MSLLTGAGFDQIQRVAKALSASTLVPVQYRAFAEVKEYGKVTGYTPNGAGLPNCIVALNMAQRMGADPLMVMQNLYVIEGRPSWSSQFIIASINSCGRFNPLRYDLSQPGKEQEVSYKATTWKNKQKVEETKTIKVRHQTCTAWTTERGVQIPTFSPEELRKKSMLQLCREYGVPVIESPEVSIQMALDEGWLTKNGSKWQTMPEVMLRYRAASLLGRLYAPELLMGLQTVEEVNDFIEPRDTDIQGETVTVHVDDLRDKEPAPPAVAAEDDGDEPSPKKVNLNDWYLANTREVQKPKRARQPKPAKATAKAETPVRKELKMGSLDHLIAPNSESEMGRPPLQLESLNDHEIALLPAPPGSAVSWELHRRTQEQYHQRWQDYLSTMTDEQVAALGR